MHLVPWAIDAEAHDIVVEPSIFDHRQRGFEHWHHDFVALVPPDDREIYENDVLFFPTVGDLDVAAPLDCLELDRPECVLNLLKPVWRRERREHLPFRPRANGVRQSRHRQNLNSLLIAKYHANLGHNIQNNPL